MELYELTQRGKRDDAASEFGAERSTVGIAVVPREEPLPLPRMVRAWRGARARDKGAARGIKWLGEVMIIKEPIAGEAIVLVDVQSGLSIATSRVERVITADGRTLVETRNSIYGLVTATPR